MSIEISPAPEKTTGWAPLALGFRPFFLLGIWFAVLLMATSLGGFVTGIWHYNYFDLPLWHAHEMVFGYAVAVIAGFLLTAVRNWTGLPTPTGKALGLLVLLWLTPRILSAVPLPPLLFALMDLLFLPVTALIIFRLVYKAKQPRNYSVPALLLLLAVGNLGLHLNQLGFIEGEPTVILNYSVLILIGIVVLIAGRVVPFFIGKTTGHPTASHKTIEKLALPSILLFAVCTILSPANWLVAAIALIVASIHTIRLLNWHTATIWKQPMLWVLYCGYGWLVAGFLFYALAIWFDVSTTEALHAWTVGVIGMFTLGMMTRVALGHTGRNIQPLSWITTAFILLFSAALSRVILPLVSPSLLNMSIHISATCWIVAFIIVGLRYSSLLLRPRIDGKPG